MKKQEYGIVAYLRDNATRPMKLKELIRFMGIKREERPAFGEALEYLIERGDVIKTREMSYALPGKINIVTGRLSCHRDGYGFVSPEEGGDDVFIPARFLRENMHGDKVAVRIEGDVSSGKREGRIIRTLERGYTKIVGRFELSRNFAYVIPGEQRITHDIYIPPTSWGKAKSGQEVVVEITAYPTAKRNPEGRVVEVLGWPDDPEVEVKTILRKYELPQQFSEEALDEARLIPQKPTARDIRGRKDLKDLFTVTIDGESARDFDDAVSIKKECGTATRLWVSIADVSHYVKEGSFLDREAYLRGTSVYFPDRCIPMLPEELSNGICSLNPDVDRLAVTAEMLFDNQGRMKEACFYPSVIRSDARLTYTLVRDILEKKTHEIREDYVDLNGRLALMKELALRLMEKRKKRGSIDFDLPEPEIVLDLQGRTESIIKAERNIAHRIIEEFMLAANEAVATHISGMEVPSIYRIHENPDEEKLADFREFIFNFGYEFKMKEGKVKPRDLQKLLEESEGRAEEKMVNEVLLRCMKQARYSVDNVGHFGLASPCYTHFTSPIRRYPDLVIHRILKSLLSGRLKKNEITRRSAVLPDTAEHSSKRERTAMDAEREIITLKKLQFMKDKTGEEYDGFISGVTSFGFFVELDEYFVEGLVHVSTLRNDFYHYDEKQHSLVGENTGERFRVGDRVGVKVVLVSLEKRQIDLVLAGDGKSDRKGVAREFVNNVRKKSLREKPVAKRGKTTAGGKSGVKRVKKSKRNERPKNRI
jgi:ribonuclease R